MNRKPILYLSAALMLFIIGCKTSPHSGLKNSGEVKANIEFDMTEVQAPAIPDYTVNIKDFGAVSGGQVMNTKAFADAIDAVTEKGGGKIIIPAGIWLTGPVILKSNLELYTEPGALIIFSKNKDDYPLIKTSFEGLDTWRCISPIYGNNVENVALTGSGVWDGSGDVWRYVKRSKLTDNQWKKLVASGGIVDEKGDGWYPSEQFKKASENADMNVPTNLKTEKDYMAIRDFLRPVMVGIQNSKRIMLNGPTFQNSPAWCIHPLIIEDLIVKNVTVRNPWYSQNGDGIDIESCKNVIVDNCNFDVGDDAICIKSGKDEDGRKRGIPSENLIITNNIVYHGHGGVTVGSEMSGGVKNMHVSNCTFIGTDVGLRFKSNRGRGGVVENIYISDINMTDIPTNAISFNLYYGGKSVSEMLEDGGPQTAAETYPVTEETPQFKNIFMKGVTVKGAQQAIYVQGLPEMNVENVTFTDMILEADKGILLIDSRDISFDNVNLYTPDHNAVEIYNCKNVNADGLKYDFKSENDITINGEGCDSIQLLSSSKNYTFIGDKVPEDAVIFNNN